MNHVPEYVAACERRPKDESLREFARRWKREHPEKALRIMENIGSWPSSEPELRALQEVYP